MKKISWFFSGFACAAILFAFYLRLTESQKRYLNHLLKQVRYLPSRYKV
jgi:hypothetical protein